LIGVQVAQARKWFSEIVFKLVALDVPTSILATPSPGDLYHEFADLRFKPCYTCVVSGNHPSLNLLIVQLTMSEMRQSRVDEVG